MMVGWGLLVELLGFVGVVLWSGVSEWCSFDFAGLY